MRSLDVVIVGAGPAGIGMALALSCLPGIRHGILERGRVGESFHRWPRQTRFITPSFFSNPFGLADLNAIGAGHSPALSSGSEHPGGPQYAHYLEQVIQANQLPLVTDCPVEQVIPLPEGGFMVCTAQGELHTRFLVWATGEYQFPDLDPFPGARHCIHYARVSDWASLNAPARHAPGSDAPASPRPMTDSPPDHTVIGGYESGTDAAIQLVRLGQRVRLLCRRATWATDADADPSLSLSPYTRERLQQALATGRLSIEFGVDVMDVTLTTDTPTSKPDEAAPTGSPADWCPRGPERQGTNADRPPRHFTIRAADGRHWQSATPPILGTGFLKGGGARQIEALWDWKDDGHVLLSPDDESTRCPGLFLVGPQVRHDARIYCFIYKFRQRVVRVARQIAQRLDIDAEGLQTPAGDWGPFGNVECCEGCTC